MTDDVALLKAMREAIADRLLIERLTERLASSIDEITISLPIEAWSGWSDDDS